MLLWIATLLNLSLGFWVLFEHASRCVIRRVCALFVKLTRCTKNSPAMCYHAQRGQALLISNEVRNKLCLFSHSRSKREMKFQKKQINVWVIWTKKFPGNVLFSHRVAPILSSPLRRLTTLFGMGRSRSTSLSSPGKYKFPVFFCALSAEEKSRQIKSFSIDSCKVGLTPYGASTACRLTRYSVGDLNTCLRR